MKYQNPSGIYIHVPFCLNKCSYCNFFSIARAKQDVISNYITALINEITQTKRVYANLRDEISSIYLGGGTPSLLKTTELAKIIETLNKNFALDFKEVVETTIEVNPGFLELSYLKDLRALGFNRISLGIQSLNEAVLKSMGRSHTAKEGLEAVDMAMRAGFDNISVDLIFNYPGEQDSDIRTILNTFMSFPGIKHISAYSLTVESKTRLYGKLKRGELKLTSEEHERELYYFIGKYLKEKGFNQYEISNYALPGFESRQNNLYWSLGSYYGFGPAASSFLKNIRVDRPKNLKSYLENKPVPKENISLLSEQDLKEEFMFLGLRKLEGIRDSTYRDIFAGSFFSDFAPALDRLKKRDLIEIIGERVKLTPLGLDFADSVALELIL